MNCNLIIEQQERAAKTYQRAREDRLATEAYPLPSVVRWAAHMQEKAAAVSRAARLAAGVVG